MEETRVGYATIDVLRNILKETILTYTKDGRYGGDVNYLHLYEEYTAFLADSNSENKQ